MSEHPLPVALIGFGGAGAGLHAPLVGAHSAFALSVVVTRNQERQRAAKARFPAAQVGSDLTAAKGCAVAVVAVPPASRARIVDQLHDLGTHVVVDKPMATDLREAEQLLGHAPLAIFHNRRWDSDFLTLRRLQGEGAWAGPARLESRLQWWQPTVRDSWRNHPTGGGILLEVGPHLIDQAITLLGPVVDVYAELDARRPGAIAEDDVFLALRHADGSLSHLSMGPVGDAHSPRFELTAGGTRITLGTPDRQQEQLAEGLAPGDDTWGMPDAHDWVIRTGPQPPAPVHAERGRWQAFYDAVVPWISQDAAPPVSAQEGLATMRVIDAARRSNAERHLVPLMER
ncbi:Gfo/Idh/MocA family oxidoreductase [Phytohabitans rumicis]|uniref:Gfo/Idh/MocA family oxidoreductase n=1 Tax=Phytohabitans rumicis TaxID=1076125 RepID=UPI0031E6B7DE